jgi:hypothetical protein
LKYIRSYRFRMEHDWEVWVAVPALPHINNIPDDSQFRLYLTSTRRDRIHVRQNGDQVLSFSLRMGYYGRGTRNIREGTMFRRQDDGSLERVVPHLFFKLYRNGELSGIWSVYVPLPLNQEEYGLDDSSHRFHPSLPSLFPSLFVLEGVTLRDVRGTDHVEISSIRFSMR